MSAETWAPAPVLGYEVSDYGRVRSMPRILTRRNGSPYTVAERILSPSRNAKGYEVVHLRLVGESRSFLVNKLVIESFRGPTPKGMETRHLNGVPSDNRLENLAFGTPAENAADKLLHGTYWRTHCPRGHALAGDNVQSNSWGRRCRTCSDAYQREYRIKRRAKVVSS